MVPIPHVPADNEAEIVNMAHNGLGAAAWRQQRLLVDLQLQFGTT